VWLCKKIITLSIFASSVADVEAIPTVFLALEKRSSVVSLESTNDGIVNAAITLLDVIGSNIQYQQAFHDYCDAHSEWRRIVETARATTHVFLKNLCMTSFTSLPGDLEGKKVLYLGSACEAARMMPIGGGTLLIESVFTLTHLVL
jgi:hypothetical protein